MKNLFTVKSSDCRDLLSKLQTSSAYNMHITSHTHLLKPATSMAHLILWTLLCYLLLNRSPMKLFRTVELML